MAWIEGRTARTTVARSVPLVGAALLAAAAVVTAAPAAAQDTAGTLITRRVAASDTTQSYAVFLPPGHGPGRAWPALLLMDPRGRALVPLERFRGEAARRGWVLISSYDTSSDRPTSGIETRRAVEVLLNETVDPLSLDRRRVYLAGFSGTARIGWTLAVQNPEIIAGVAGFGAGIPGFVDLVAREVVRGAATGAYFGGAGRLDFNYLETMETESRVRSAGDFAWVAYYPGPHAWPPDDVASASLVWLDLHAVRTGLVTPDPAELRSRAAALTDRADSLRDAGRFHEAWRAYDHVVTGFDGLTDVDRARRERDRLGDHRQVRRTRSSLERWTEWEGKGRERVTEAVQALDAPSLPALDDLVRRAGLREILEHAASADTLAAQAAERQIALLLTFTTFYRFTELVDAGRHDRAVRSLELAWRARPESPVVCMRFRQVPPADRTPDSPLHEACGQEDGG